MINKKNIKDIYTLSPMQEGMLFHSIYNKYSSAYFEQTSYRLNGTLNIALIKKSLNELMKRYDVLRTVFIYEGTDRPIQVVLHERDCDFYYECISEKIDSYSREKYIKDFKEKDKQRSFDLTKDVLIRVAVIQLSNIEYEFIWSCHHIIIDGWCMGIIVSDFFEIYKSFHENRKYILPNVKPYRIYIQWLERQDREEAIRYWENYLDGFEEQTGIPKLKRSKESSIYKNEALSIVLDTEKTANLNKLASINNSTLNTVTQALWGIFLGKYIGKEDIVFGTVVSGRPSVLEGIESMVGLFINIIPLRIRLEEDIAFNGLIRKIQQEAIINERFHYHPLAEIQTKTLLKQNLIDHIFVFENFPVVEELEGFGKNDNNEISLNLKNVEMFEQTNYDFNIILESAARLKITFQYNGECYSRDFIDRIANYFGILANQVIDDPEIMISKITLLSEKEKYRVLYEFNDTRTEYPKDKTIQYLFEEQVLLNPDKIAVFGASTGEMNDTFLHLTFKEISEYSNRLAYGLQKKGVNSGIIVGIMVERSIEMLVGILGILKANGVYLPIDPDYPKDRIDYMMKDSGSEIFLTGDDISEECLKEMEPNPIEQKEIESIHTIYTGFSHQQDALAYVIYTSGSTGKPKGVLVGHRNVIRLVKNTTYIHFNKQGRILQTGSLSFDASTFEMWGALLNSWELILVPMEYVLNPERLKLSLFLYDISTIWMTSALFNQMADADESIFTNLKNLLVGGEVLSPLHINRIRKKFPALNLINGYGPTENTTFSTTYSIVRDYEWNIPIGRPISNSTVYILDKNKNILPVGVLGEMYLGGDGVSWGYLNNQELTAEKFLYMSFTQRNSVLLYKTGDIALWLPDGNIEFVGRVDNQVKLRGYRIELGEIEKQLFNYKGIKEAVVLVRHEESGAKYLCAYFVSDKEYDLHELREFMAKELPEYMIPSYFVQLDKMPLTSNGKLDQQALPEISGLTLTEERGYIHPSTALEIKMAEIWAKVLGKETIGINENFFMIGGDSIKAIQIISRMNSAGYKLEMKDLFQYPVISDLASLVKKVKRIPIQAAVTGTIPLTPIQIDFFKNYPIDQHHFNQAVLLYSKDRFDRDAILAVFSKIQEHHDAIRIVFNKNGIYGEINQFNHNLDYRISLEEYDLRNSKNILAEFNEKLNAVQASIDLEHGPLMKLGLFHLGDGDRLLIVIHHLVIDGISWRILFEDIETLYSQYKKGEKLTLPLKTDSFKLWSENILKYANSKSFFKEKKYWQLIESTDISPIKTDWREVENYVKDSVNISFSLNVEDTEKLLTQVNRAFRTEINDILLMAVGMAIKKSFGIELVLIALEGHGREELLEDIDISRTVGWFTSIFPVILDMSYSNDLGREIKEIKEILRRIPNKGIGYGILKYLTSVENKREIDFKLKPQISFNYLGQFDADINQKSCFEIAKESAGISQSLNGNRQYLIDVSGMIANNCLTISIVYNKKHFKPDTVSGLIGNVELELKRVVEFCSSKVNLEFTPSDFTYKALSIETVDRIMNEYKDVEDVYTLTPMQEGMLFHALLDRSSSSYFEQMSYRLQGELDIYWVEESLKELFKRHDILRTAFAYIDSERPLQVVLKDRTADFYYKDISQIDNKAEKEILLEEFKRKDKGRLFDLSKDVLMRVSILRVEELEFECIWSFHHILMDGWCLGILNTDFLEIYSSFKEKRPYRLPEIKSFRTYIQWLEMQEKEEASKYWQNYLLSFEEQTVVPKTCFSSKKNGYKNEVITVILDNIKTANLKKVASENHATLNSVMQTIWGILLGKYNRSEDVIFGSVVSGRPAELDGVESMVGLFINTIPVRIHFQDNIKFDQLLQLVQKEAIAGERYHFYPLAEIQASTVLKQNLIDHILIFENYPIAEQIEGYGKENKSSIILNLKNMERFEQTNYDFNIAFEVSNRLIITFQYNGNDYERNFIKKISTHFLLAINQVLESQDMQISEFTFLLEEEKSAILYEFNATKTDCPLNKTIYDIFEEQVEMIPDHIALVGPSVQKLYNTPLQISYKELSQKSNRLASYLLEKGIVSETIIGVRAERSMEMIIGVLGILKVDGAYLPIDPEYPKDRIDFMVKDSGARIILTGDEIAEACSLEKDDLYQSRNQTENTPVWVEQSSARLAYVIYTSGSTGRPKGVMVEHQNVIRLVRNSGFIQYSAKDRLLPTGPISFDISTFEVWGPLLNGVMAIFISKEFILNTELLKNALKKHCISILHLVPQLFNQMASVDIEIFHGLRFFLIGGDLVNSITVNQLRNAYPDLKIIHCYGPTENTTFSTTFLVDKDYENRIPIGKPIGNSTAYIVDRNDMLLPIGIPGELCVGGYGIARGYLNYPELSVEKFVKNNFEKFNSSEVKQAIGTINNNIIYKTGDLARWLIDGNIEFIGRIDNQVKIRGFRIELGEIERWLQIHEIVKEIIVVDKENYIGGGENSFKEKYLCAYIVPKSPLVLDDKLTFSKVLREYLMLRLPEYMIPSFFIFLDSFPLTPNGKINRDALPAESIDERTVVAPRSEIEQKLSQIWSDVLGIPENVISVDSNFFELGGHSLKLTSVLSKIHKELNVRLLLSEMFKRPTIAEVAEYITKMEVNVFCEIEPVEKMEYYQVSSAQKRMFVLNRMKDIEDISDNAPAVLFVEGDLNIIRVKSALDLLAKRHESLRTSFKLIGEEPVQIIDDSIDFELDYYDLEGVEDFDRERRTNEILKNFVRAFDLSKAPLFRVGMAKFYKEKYLFFYDIHHIITDGRSSHVFVSEFRDLYDGNELPEQRIQYKDFAVWQNHFQQSAAMRKQEEYWKKVFSGNIPVLNMPFDYPRPAIQSFEGDFINFQLDDLLTSKIKELAAEIDGTIYIVLLSIYNVLLSKYTGQEDIVIGTSIAGRNHVDLERVIGFFVNTLAMRNYPKGNLRFREFVTEVKENALSAYENQDFQFDELVKLLGVVRNSSRNPLFDFHFTVENSEIITAPNQSKSALKFSDYPFDIKATQFDIIIHAIDLGTSILFHLRYWEKIFRRTTMEKFIEHFKMITSIVIENKDLLLNEIKIFDSLYDKKLETPDFDLEF